MFKERKIRLHLSWEEYQKVWGLVLCHHQKGGTGIPPPEMERLQQVEKSEKGNVQNDLMYTTKTNHSV